MKKLVGLLVLACGLFVYPCISFAENIWADIFIAQNANTGFFGGLVGGDGNPGPTSIDWGIGNASVFGTVTDDMVFSTCTGDFMTGSNWKERMRITKDGNVGIGTSEPMAKLDVNGGIKISALNQNFNFDGGVNMIGSGSVWNLRATTTFTDDTEVFGVYDHFGGSIAVFRNHGNVGINTTAPDTKLTIQAGAVGEWVLNVGGTGNARMKVRHIDGKQDDNEDVADLYLQHDMPFNTIINYGEGSGNVGIGITDPSEKLEVDGNVRADAFLTGDIYFHKDDKPVWRMYEDEKGLYAQSLTTDKKYTFILKEIGDVSGVVEMAAKGVGDKIQKLQEDNKALKEANNALESRLAKIESLLNARQ